VIIKPQSIASRPKKERVRIGKDVYETHIHESLRGKGYILKDATSYEDKIQKIDCYIIAEGREIPVQSKYRETGIDIGMDIYEPWFGLSDSRTKPGRDSQSEAQLYASQSGSTLYLVSKASLQQIADAVMDEWKNLNFKFDFGDGIQRGTFNSRIYSNVQLKYKIDEENGTPKIIAYIPPTVVKSEFCLTFTVKPIEI
jgi:hypothetical protein